jgi:enediyne biosynthesis protein E4
MVDEVNLQVKYKEPLLLFENRDGILKNISAHSGSIFAKDFPARGLATGDVDNDGDLDVLINVNGQSPLLLRNSGGDRHHWIGLKLVATKSNPAAVGALITWRIGERKRSRLKTSGGSYLSWHDPREILGLGPATKIDELEIRWPSGQVDRVLNPPVDTYVELREGSGTGSRQLPKAETQR